MKKVLAWLVILALPTCVSAASSARTKLALEAPVPEGKVQSLLSLQLTTGMDIPLGDSLSVFEAGAGLQGGVEYRLPFLPALSVRGVLGYHNEAPSLVYLSVSIFSVSVGIGARIDLLPWLSVSAGVSGGGFGCFLSTPAAFGANAVVSADAGLLLLPGPWRLTLGASYRNFISFYQVLSATLGLSYELPPVRAQ
jgi:hypothetical protein